MKLKLLAAVGTAALMAVPSLASADDSGWYLRGNVGYGTHTDATFTGDLVGTVESEGNATGSVGVGYDFGNNWRLELDGASLWTDMGAISGYPGSYAKMRTTTGMLNAIYDFSDFGRWEPYIGAGVGVVQGKLSAVANDFPSDPNFGPGVVNVNNPACPTGAACGFRETDSGWAWQLLAGLGYNITDNLTWDTHYRYMNATRFDYDGIIAPTLGTTQAAKTTMNDVAAHSVMTGFRYKFGAKPAPMVTCWDGSQASMLADCPVEPVRTKICWDQSEVPVDQDCPVQPPATQICWDNSEILATETCPARPTFTCDDGSIVSDQSICELIRIENLCAEEFRQEIIYYDFDKGQSAETRNTIQRILDTSQYCAVDNVRVVGHTDTSGSAAYNLALSKKRAKDARDELVRQGIPSDKITSEGKGETEPFVQTGDGVKEQLNRRTEVLIQLSETGRVN